MCFARGMLVMMQWHSADRHQGWGEQDLQQEGVLEE